RPPENSLCGIGMHVVRRLAAGRGTGEDELVGVRGSVAIVGLGITEMGKVYGKTATGFAADAIALALEDAGLTKADVDGLLIHSNASTEMTPALQISLGLTDPTPPRALSP